MFKDAGFRQRDIQKLGDDKLFIGPKHNIYAFSWFYLVYLIWYYYLFVCQICHENSETENWK